MARPPATRASVIAMAVRWPPAEWPEHEHAGRVAAELLGVVDHPGDGRAHLGDDLVDARGRRQRVLDAAPG